MNFYLCSILVLSVVLAQTTGFKIDNGVAKDPVSLAKKIGKSLSFLRDHAKYDNSKILMC